MRLVEALIIFLLFGILCGQCDGPDLPPVRVVTPQLSSPAAAEYPVVEHAMFEAFSTSNGSGALTIVLRNEDGKLDRRYFFICFASQPCDHSGMILDTVDLPETGLVAGDKIVITRTSDTAYAITRAE